MSACGSDRSEGPPRRNSSTASAAAASASAQAAPLSPAEARAAAFESSLLPAFDLNGVDLRMKLADRMAKWGVPAVGVAVVEGNAIQFARTYGVLERARDPGDRKSEIGADVDTVFQAASISKPITAAAILALVDQHQLDLDKPVNSYLRAWKLDDSVFTKDHPVTIRGLLSHTAGINAPEQQLYVSYPESFGGYKPGAAIPTTVQVLDGAPPALTVPVEAMKDSPCPEEPSKPPKPCFKYSGGGYTILELVVQDVTGQPFGAAIQRLVFDPIGMRHSSFSDAPPTPNAARAHRGDANTPPGGWIVVAEKAAGGLWTTPSDLALFLIDLSAAYRGEEGHVLTPASARAMLSPVANARPLLQASMGLGMFLSDDPGDLVFSHNGHNPGYHATIVALPALGKGFVVMTNRETGAEIMGEISNSVGEVFDWPARSGLRARKRELFPVAPEALRGFAGSYSGGGFLDKPLRARVRTEGAQIFAKVDELDEAQIYAIGEGEFVDPFAPAVLRFKVSAPQALSSGAVPPRNAKDEPQEVSLEYDSPAGKRTATRDEPRP
ncbi:MAG: serine hydrolase domain-containing protein [Polyangiaceae bacterium]